MFSNKYVITLLLSVIALAMFMVVFVHTSKNTNMDQLDNSITITENNTGAREVVGQVPDVQNNNEQQQTQRLDPNQRFTVSTSGQSATQGSEQSISRAVNTNTAPTTVSSNSSSNRQLDSIGQTPTLADTSAKPNDTAAKPTGAENTVKSEDETPTNLASVLARTTTEPAAQSGVDSSRPKVTENSASAKPAPAQPAPTPVPTKPAEVRNYPSPSAKTGKGAIETLSLHFQGNGMYVRIEGSSVMPVKWFTLSNPERLVVDLPGNWTGLKAPTIPSNQLITGIRLGRTETANRIVFDASRPLKNVRLERMSDNKVEILFE